MSALDRQYDVWDMAMVIDEIEPFGSGFYTYAGAPAWFTPDFMLGIYYFPSYTFNVPQGVSGAFVITVSKFDGSFVLVDTITITINVTAVITETWNISHCSTANLVWLGPFGGYESYMFQSKQSLEQSGGKAKTFKDQNGLVKFQDRGDIFQGVMLTTANIPTAHIEHIANMHKAIQAWLWTSGNVFVEILIDPTTFKKARTREPYISYEFSFTYAKPDVIQTQ